MLSDALLTRIRAEFLEMPGLKLTTAEAMRLWSLDETTCGLAIDALVSERFLHRTPSGAVVALPSATKMVRTDTDGVSMRCPSCQHLNTLPAPSSAGRSAGPLRCAACSRLMMRPVSASA